MARPQATIANAEAAIQAFPLDRPTVLRAFETSKRNDNFLVLDERGERHVLRRYQRNPDPKRIRFQLDFERALHRLHFPTPRVIESRSGLMTHTDQLGVWALFEFVAGDPYDYSIGPRVEQAAAQLAEFHKVAAQLDIEEVVEEVNTTIESWWRTLEADQRDLVEMFKGLPVDAEMEWLVGWTDSLRASWGDGLMKALPQGWCHGDWNPQNLIFQGDNVAAVLDYDVVHRGPLIDDVNGGAYFIGRTGSGANVIRFDVFGRFLREYHCHRPLTAAELAVLPDALVAYWVPDAKYLRLLQRDGEDIVRVFKWAVTRVQAMHAQRDKVREALAGVGGA